MDESNQELINRVETLEAKMGEHRHNVVDGSARLDQDKIITQDFTDASSVTPRAEDDFIDITALAQAITFNNPAGTLANFDKLIIRILDDGTARGITWGSAYASGGPTLPSTTTISKMLHLGFIYNKNTSKYYLVAKAEQT